MRRIVAAAFVSLDGVMQAPGGPEEDPTGGFAFGGWTFHLWDDVMGQAMGEMFAEPFDLLLGRKTYEIFAAHWPYVGPDDPIGQLFDRVTKYVVSRSNPVLDWQNSVALHGIERVAELKQGEGPILLTQGSSYLIQSLLAAGLIDEFRLLTFPVLLGKGKKLIGEGTLPTELELVRSVASTTGVILATYRPTGPVRSGSFQLADPTPSELARRERMKREG